MILMLLVIISFVITYFYVASIYQEEEVSGVRKGSAIIHGSLFFLILLFSSISVVDAGEVGVKVLFGKAEKQTLKEGINLVNPFASVKTYSIRLKEYTMSSTSSDGDRSGDDSMKVRTINNMEVTIDLSLWYKIDANKAYNIYRNIAKDEDRLKAIIRSSARSVIRDIASKYKDFDSLNKARKEFSLTIKNEMQKTLNDKGVLVDNILIRNITPPAILDTAINNKLKRQQELEEREYKKKIAVKDAEIKIIEAKGLAKAQQIINRSLTYNYLQFMAIKAQEKMAGSPNHTTVYIPVGANGIPLVKRTR